MRFRIASWVLALSLAIAGEANAQECESGPLDGLGSLLGNLTKIWRPWSGPGSGGNSGWIQREGKLAPATDSTAQFQRIFEAVKAGKSVLPPDAKDPVYLVVTGLFTKHYPGYMKDNIARMKALGLDTQEVPVDTAGSVLKNAEIVRNWIEAASAGGRKVVLVTHSKGGVDTTAALSLYPELRGKVRALVAMQTPFAGTPLATDIKETKSTNWMTRHFTEDVLDGDPNSVFDLGYAERKAFLAAHPYQSEVPTVSLATSRKSYISMVGLTEWYMADRYGLLNDGMVPMNDAEIPGSKVVRLLDMDHAQSTFRGLPGEPKHVPGDLTEALIALALRSSR